MTSDTRALVEALAQFLHDEVDLPDKIYGAVWPLHDDDDGFRGDSGYVRLQPKDIVEHYREAAGRVAIRLSQHLAALAALSSPAVPGGVEESNSFIDRLLAKFPDFNPSGDAAYQQRWMEDFGRLVSLSGAAPPPASGPVSAWNKDDLNALHGAASYHQPEHERTIILRAWASLSNLPEGGGG